MDPKAAQLTAEAVKLYKALTLIAAIRGLGAQAIPPAPNYRACTIRMLEEIIEDLEAGMMQFGELLLLELWSPLKAKSAAGWLALKHDEWVAAGEDIFEIGRVHEVEGNLGPLVHRTQMECPPYAQVLLQGFYGAAIRHPEYHLAHDLALLNNLFLDAEETADDHLRNNRQHSTQNCQSLARTTILCCYNLLESFVSGLVAAFVLDNPGAPSETLQKLQNPDRKRSSLKARFEDVPAIIADKEGVMEPLRPVLEPLFGTCKWRRDSFVHCEPGPAPTKFGTVKESLFHEADADTVKQTVSLTIKAIRAAWKIIHNTPGPRWLPDPEPSGRFSGIGVKLVEITPEAPRKM